MQGPIIKTKYSGPTNVRGAIVIASHRRDSQTRWRAFHPWDDSMTVDENHIAAAHKLVERWPLNAKGKIAATGYDADCQYHVFALEAYD